MNVTVSLSRAYSISITDLSLLFACSECVIISLCVLLVIRRAVVLEIVYTKLLQCVN